MTKEELLRRSEAIDDEIAKRAAADKAVDEPIRDGAVDEEQYLAAWPKMLWVLKEPWEESDAGEARGGWSLTKDLMARGKVDNKTYPPMAYISYSTYSGFIGYARMQKVEWKAVVESLKKIAYINVSKMPGNSTSDIQALKGIYTRNKDLLFRQIALFDADVTIFGHTLEFFQSDLDLPDVFTTRGSASYLIKNEKLYVEAYHPAQRTYSVEQYVDDIVRAVRLYCADRKGK